jgi:hypothetical protein
MLLQNTREVRNKSPQKNNTKEDKIFQKKIDYIKDLKFGCLHPAACTRSGSGFPSNASLFRIFYSIIATCFDRMTVFRRKYM